MEKKITPVLLGADLNCYSVARAFYEQYQVKSYVFGKYQTGPSFNSQITIYEGNPQIDKDDYFLERINRFAKEHSDKKILLIGCGDSYVALCSKHKSELAENVVAPYIDFDLMDSLQQKERFYQLCEKHGVAYPKTIVYRPDMISITLEDCDTAVILVTPCGCVSKSVLLGETLCEVEAETIHVILLNKVFQALLHMLLDHRILMVHVMVDIEVMHCSHIEERIVLGCAVACSVPPSLGPWV